MTGESMPRRTVRRHRPSGPALTSTSHKESPAMGQRALRVGPVAGPLLVPGQRSSPGPIKEPFAGAASARIPAAVEPKLPHPSIQPIKLFLHLGPFHSFSRTVHPSASLLYPKKSMTAEPLGSRQPVLPARDSNAYCRTRESVVPRWSLGGANNVFTAARSGHERVRVQNISSQHILGLAGTHSDAQAVCCAPAPGKLLIGLEPRAQPTAPRRTYACAVSTSSRLPTYASCKTAAARIWGRFRAHEPATSPVMRTLLGALPSPTKVLSSFWPPFCPQDQDRPKSDMMFFAGDESSQPDG
ncbi:hypothetical protein CDD83_9313 [Cordyceps sp. RAO-2017]|nr:hypothetical protein CDD83_9313 [Cordyceps sp. RAO-2017]